MFAGYWDLYFPAPLSKIHSIIYLLELNRVSSNFQLLWHSYLYIKIYHALTLFYNDDVSLPYRVLCGAGGIRTYDL